MNILLTGGAGYIGSHTVIALSEAGHTPVIYDNFCNSNKSVVERLEKIIGKPVAMVEGDIRDTPLLTKTLQNHEINAVIHFAGLKAVGESSIIPLEYYSSNVYGTLCLLEAMNQARVKNLVFSSSATVYGDPQYLPLDEQHPLSATNPYGRTKLHIEEILKDLKASDSEWNVLCLRYFNPVGAHVSGLIGEDPNGVPNNLLPFIAQVAAGKLAKLKIFGNDYSTPDGTGVRDYIHVMDLAEGHLAALSYLEGLSDWTAINLGTGQGYSVLEMIKAYEMASRIEIPFEFTLRRPGDIAACYASVEKAKSDLGWVAKRGLEDICVSSYKWQTYRSSIA
ncbi:UDP-glucose 4-epimerase GalE [Polynucleobacter sp. MWH-UH19D]|uniref:UDP-glucose 4-epimerase GalE n=1 Tax=Polynucleobacter sp. MWH-UH19D TaxID=1855610 RepID=UPI003364B895